jgi:uncharacterized protein (TIGR02996 family)
VDDGAALLAAIREFWYEDTPRLAYADFLEGNGEADRAEFIRLGCEADRGVSHRLGDLAFAHPEWWPVEPSASWSIARWPVLNFWANDDSPRSDGTRTVADWYVCRGFLTRLDVDARLFVTRCFGYFRDRQPLAGRVNLIGKYATPVFPGAYYRSFRWYGTVKGGSLDRLADHVPMKIYALLDGESWKEESDAGMALSRACVRFGMGDEPRRRPRTRVSGRNADG